MESTAFNLYQLHNAAGNPLHSIGIHCARLHGIHCIQSGYIGPAACNPLHSLRMHFTLLHGIQCIQSVCILISCMESIQSSRCMDSAAFNRHPLRHAAWNPLHSIGIHWASLHGIHCVQSRSIGPRCMESTAFNHAA